jgi:hypothetical protein
MVLALYIWGQLPCDPPTPRPSPWLLVLFLAREQIMLAFADKAKIVTDIAV